jgi:hypothetical protein
MSSDDSLTIMKGTAMNFFDFRKLRRAVREWGWKRCVFVVCLSMLFMHRVTFNECLILLLVAAQWYKGERLLRQS